jgi:hypothetical protein
MMKAGMGEGGQNTFSCMPRAGSRPHSTCRTFGAPGTTRGRRARQAVAGDEAGDTWRARHVPPCQYGEPKASRPSPCPTVSSPPYSATSRAGPISGRETERELARDGERASQGWRGTERESASKRPRERKRRKQEETRERASTGRRERARERAADVPSTRRFPQNGPFIRMVPKTNCAAHRHLSNRSFDCVCGRDHLRMLLGGRPRAMRQ